MMKRSNKDGILSRYDKIFFLCTLIIGLIYFIVTTYQIKRYPAYCKKRDCIKEETNLVYGYNHLTESYGFETETECVEWTDYYTIKCTRTKIIKRDESK